MSEVVAPVADEAAKADAEYRAGLAAMMKGDEEEPTPEKKKPDEPAKPEAEEEEKPDEPEEKGEEEEEKEEGEEKPEDKGKYSKAFRQLQKQEADLQQLKAQTLSEKRELEKREKTVQTDMQELGGWIKQLRIDPFGTLLKAGMLTEEDAEYASKQLYFHSKAAAADPKNKAEAERLRRERELVLEHQQTRQEVEKLRQEREAERADLQKQQNLNAYVQKMDATIDSYKIKTPLLAKALEKNPERTKQELYQVANELSAAKQAFADPGLVVLAWVKQRKQLLADHGISEPVAKSSEQDKSKKPDEKKGPPNGTNGKNKTQSDPAAFDEDAFKKELAARLRGEITD